MTNDENLGPSIFEYDTTNAGDLIFWQAKAEGKTG